MVPTQLNELCFDRVDDGSKCVYGGLLGCVSLVELDSLFSRHRVFKCDAVCNS